MSYIFETERLKFRQFVPDDLPLLIEQRSDPDVNRYLGGVERQNPEALTRRIEFYISCYESHGFAMCPMISKETGKVIGTAGIQPLEDTGEIEVGYSLIRSEWGKGLATEAAYGWLDFGFNKAGLHRIVAVAFEENLASQRIMERLGMQYEKTEQHYGYDCVFYAISKEDFLRNINR